MQECIGQQSDRYLLYSIKEGLSQNSVQAIHRDRDKLLWVGTQDGLNSFDGKNFTVYRHSDDTTSISDQFITRIEEDQKANLWIGTRNGLNYFDKQTKQFKRVYIIPEEKHVFQASYFNFLVQNDGKLLVNHGSLYIVDPVSFFKIEIPIPHKKLGNWILTHDYSAWAITEDNEVYYFPDTRKKQYISKGQSPFNWVSKNKYINAKLVDNSLLFVFDESKMDKIYVYDPKSFLLKQTISLPFTASHINIISPQDIIAAGSQGVFITGLNGHSRFMFQQTDRDNRLPAGSILSTYKDSDENLWIGTSGNGFAIRNPSFDNYQLIRINEKNERINCITLNGSTLYAGTHNGLFKIENFADKKQKHFIPLLGGKSVTAVTTDLKNQIWIGVKNEGVLILNKQGQIIKRIPLDKSLPYFDILNMIRDTKGRILISTTVGLYIAMSERDSIKKYSSESEKNKIIGQYVMSAFEDRENNIWIASNNGLDMLNGSLQLKNSFNSIDDKSSFLKRTIITSVTQDMDGAIWIATIRNGVYKLFNNQSIHYNHKSGLTSDVVYDVVCDNRNRVWATTSTGINVFNKKENAFNLLTSFDGIPNVGYDFGAVYKNGNTILYGTSDGLLICNASEIKTEQTGISAFISAVKMNGNTVNISNHEWEVIADNKQISFELSPTPAFYTGNIIYQYRLSGQHENWITLPRGTQNISYGGLPYNKLKLEVRAAASVNNLETATITSLNINSKAPFWKTDIFRVAAFLVMLSLLLMLVKFYNDKKNKKQLETIALEKELQKERSRIGRDLHDNIGAYTSALIAGLNQIHSNDEKQKTAITDLKEYGANIMGFLRETIWMLNAEKLTVTAFADRFKNYALRINKNYPEIDFNFKEQIENDRTLSPTVMLNLFRILQEALQNACKHSGTETINFEVLCNHQLHFSITDQGKGFIEHELLDHYGIRNIKERAAEIGFELNIQTSEKGTQVSILKK